RLWGNKLISINSGIELSRFLKKDESLRKSYRKKLNLDYDDKVFINVANWQPWRKGQDLILKSFANLDCNKCKLLFVGNDTDSKEVKKLINDYGLEGRVLGLGFREDVENLLNASDFFVFASYNETLAAAVVQAMASGKVVISTLAGGIGEYLKDGYNGFTVKVGDQKELEEKMRKALNISEKEYNLISSRAVNTAKKYSIEETTKKWVNLINNLVNS
ncbi:glycosyltransferase family 4 protein, partial [Persephonella sp.]